MKTRTESDIVKECMAVLAADNIFHWRQNNNAVKGRAFIGLKGVPDILCLIKNGKLMGVEVKTLIGKQSPEQIEFERNCEKRGAIYLLVRSAHELENILNDMGDLL